MIKVPMGVDGVINSRTFGSHPTWPLQSRNRLINLVHHLRELIVNDHDTVLADGNGNVAANAEQNEETVTDLFTPYFGSFKIPTEHGH